MRLLLLSLLVVCPLTAKEMLTSEHFNHICHAESAKYDSALTGFYTDNKMELMGRLLSFPFEIVSDLTADEFFEFICTHGGTRIYWGRNKSKIEKKLNIELTDREFYNVSSKLGPDGFLEIPSAMKVLSSLRAIAYENDIRANVPDDEVKKRYGISQRTINNFKRSIQGQKK
ncbi:hypothetical protein HUZ36_04635 [Pseudoalteromonas sp. McH1-7]|uniref:hypothetical protein n=1 Tax=Pseudoalteromonas sp. McH1-7 TaxID=2745574 RepID=UPI0015918138|nr:hypothetical protein [Pseudoalteromonas sp. McH1-7]NUZ10060.1 hypothetical protein [Pseudoalteromonas sp. McH1-7]